MRTIYSFIAAFVISLFTGFVNAQVQWIADASFNAAPYASLYKMLEDGKPVVMAIGDVHAQSSERLIASGSLQKLAAEHGAGKFGDRFSDKDLRIVFINVQVMQSEQENNLPKGLQFIHMNEGDEALNSAGWSELYSIASTRLFLVTPDHLVRPLNGKTADELLAEVKFFNSKIRPSATPDIRLLDATTSGNGKTAHIRVQNFSTLPVSNVQVSILKDGQQIGQTTYNAAIASLEDAVVSLNLPAGADEHISIVAKAEGDTNQLNNRWVGAPRIVVDATMIAGK